MRINNNRAEKKIKNLGDIESIDELHKNLGRYPTNDEYREFIYPKLVDELNYWKSQGVSDNAIVRELKDGYGYDDLIKKAFAEWDADETQLSELKNAFYDPRTSETDRGYIEDQIKYIMDKRRPKG